MGAELARAVPDMRHASGWSIDHGRIRRCFRPLYPLGEMAVEVILTTGKADLFALGALLGNARSAT
jgi:hypothetical protein